MNRTLALGTILVVLFGMPLFGQTSKQIKEPVLIQAVDPAYPSIALQARIEGIVVLEFTVGSDGRVSDVKVIKSKPLLDEAAVEAVKQWRYKPGQIDGKPAAFTGTTSVKFQLNYGETGTGEEQKAVEKTAPPTTFKIAPPQIESPAAANPSPAAQETEQHPDAAGQGAIPEKILKLLDGGLAKRKGRQDIFLFVAGHSVLPGEQNEMFGAFNIKVKSGDLDPSKVGSGRLEAYLSVFARFHPLTAGAPEAAIRELRFPGYFFMGEDQFDPKREDLYCYGYSLPPGGYVMALAVATQDLKRIGVTYYEFVLPEASGTTGLDLTSVVIAKDIQSSPAMGPRPYLGLGSYKYPGREIHPNVDGMIGGGESLKIIFGVLGAKRTAQKKVSLEVSYEIRQEDKSILSFPKAAVTAPLVEASLPLKTKGPGKAAASVELPSGNYTLVIRILDKLSNKAAENKIDFFKL